MKWEGAGVISGFKWAGQLFDGNNNAILLNGEPVFYVAQVGTIEVPGEGYGFDSTGSPSWNKLFSFLNTTSLEYNESISETEAKAVYQADFVLGNLILISVNGKKVQ